MKKFFMICSITCILLGAFLIVYFGEILSSTGFLLLCFGMSAKSKYLSLQEKEKAEKLTIALNKTIEIVHDLEIKVSVLNVKHGFVYHENGYLEHLNPKSDEAHDMKF